MSELKTRFIDEFNKNINETESTQKTEKAP